MSEYIVARANALVFAGLILLLVLIGAGAWERFDATRSAREWTQHTLEVIDRIEELNLNTRRAESGERGYLLTGIPEYLTPYTQSLERLNELPKILQQLVSDNPEQEARLGEMRPLLQDKLTELATAIQTRRDSGAEAALRVMQTYQGNMVGRRLEAMFDAFTAAEHVLLTQRLDQAQSRGAWVRGLLAAGTFVSVLTLLWAARSLSRAWARSSTVEATQRNLAMRLRASLDSLSQGVAVFGDDFRLINWNHCFEVLLGVPKPLLREGTAYSALVEQVAGATAGASLEREDQVRHSRNASNEPVTYEIGGVPHGATGDLGHLLEIRRTPMPDRGFVLTISDMTKRAQAEAVLRESQKMQAIGQLTGGIAHDFNNLLTVILGNLEFVRNKLGQGQQEKAPLEMASLETRIERAMWATQRGATLTGQLLAFARKQPLAPTAIDLTETVPELIPLLRRTLGEHIDVRYVETAGLWPAMADAAQLESALLNLALNARDAMPGGGRLTIELANKVLDRDYARAHAEVTAGDYAMLAVSDTGHGMTPDIVARVFEPFFTTKADGRGTGLGLAMVFGFVKQSGGHIKVYSEPGDGTTVRLYLPRAIAASPTAVQRSAKPLDLPQGAATILVVEDEPAVREIAVAILAELGYRVFEASDGDEGLRVFGSHAAEIDLLLTDVVLPGKVRGREMAERIVSIRPEVKVLFMSGYTENSIVHQGRLDDGVHLLGKPFHREQLARKVAEVLSQADTNVVALKPRRM